MGAALSLWAGTSTAMRRLCHSQDLLDAGGQPLPRDERQLNRALHDHPFRADRARGPARRPRRAVFAARIHHWVGN